MLTDRLFERVLMLPRVETRADTLWIVSGYATPSFAYRHLADSRNAGLSVRLAVGMVPSNGIARPYHRGFQALMQRDHATQFEARYVTSPPPIHAKIYVFSRRNTATSAFIGSANYTSNGFEGGVKEVMTAIDPATALAFAREVVEGGSKSCLDIADDSRLITEAVVSARIAPTRGRAPSVPSQAPTVDTAVALESRTISLLSSRARGGVSHGLNWGQRPSRNSNEAYLNVPASVAQERFLPPRGRHFTLYTDDGEAFDAVVAQDGNKAIETPVNNSLLGAYLRRRLGVASGAPVTVADLEAYGRTDYTLRRLSEDVYLLDLSV